VYFRVLGGSSEFVRLTSQERIVYSLPQGKCTALSRTGRYFSVASLTGADLEVRRLDSEQTLMLQASWNPDWEFCSNGFWGDDAIAVNDQTQANTRLYFDFSSGQLMPVNPPLIPAMMMPS
jgi:hypothetical protein